MQQTKLRESAQSLKQQPLLQCNLWSTAPWFFFFLFFVCIWLNTQWIYIKRDKSHNKQKPQWIGCNWSANSHLVSGCLESEMEAHTAVTAFYSSSLLCTFKSTEKLDLLHVSVKWNTPRPSCSLGWCEHIEDSTIVLEAMATFAHSTVVGWHGWFAL